jgi:hypothetical protein
MAEDDESNAWVELARQHSHLRRGDAEGNQAVSGAPKQLKIDFQTGKKTSTAACPIPPGNLRSVGTCQRCPEHTAQPKRR